MFFQSGHLKLKLFLKTLILNILKNNIEYVIDFIEQLSFYLLIAYFKILSFFNKKQTIFTFYLYFIVSNE